MRAAVLTVSDRVSRGEAEDGSGDTLEELLLADGYEVVRRLVPDEREEIARAIVELAARRPRSCSRPAAPASPPATSRPRRRARCSSARRRASPRRSAPTRSRRRRTACSPAASPARVGGALVVNLAGSPGACRDGYAVLRPALPHALKLLADQRPRPTTSIHDRHRRTRRRHGAPVRAPDQGRAHDLRAALRLRRRAARGRRGPVGARPALDHGRDGRRPLARDGAQPADRRRHRRPQPAHRRPRDPLRAALDRQVVALLRSPRSLVFLVAVWQLDPVVRWLWPIPVAAFVVYPYLKRFTWLCHLWLGAVDGLAPVGAWVAITGELPWQAWALGGAVATWVAGFDLFYSLFDLEIDRAAGAALVGDALRRARRLRGRAAACTSLTVALLVAAGLGLRSAGWYWVGVVAVAGAARLRARARAPGRPAPARRGVLHDERRDQRRVLRVRARGRRS